MASPASRSEPAILLEESGTRELWTLQAPPEAREPVPAAEAAPARAAADPAPAEEQLAGFEAPHGESGAARWAPAHKWFRRRASATAFTLPPLPAPPRTAVPKLRRGVVETWWSARRARGGVEEFLRERLARYLAQSGVPRDRLPVTISVESGRAAVAPRPGGPVPPEWVAAYVRGNGEPALAAEIERAQAEMARAAAALEGARERLARARAELDAAARAPSLSSSDGDAGSPLGRPAVPPQWALAIAVGIGAMVLGNAWQLALPLLARAGIAPSAIAAEAQLRPEAVALPLLLALGASACLFVFCAAALRRGRALLQAMPARWQAAVHAVAGAASLGLALLLAWVILVPGPAGRARDLTSFLVAMALPIAAPALAAAARRLHAARTEALRAAAAWDHVHRAAVARWTRANAAATAAERECAALEARRAEWAQRHHQLRARCAEVARRAADAAEAEAAEIRRLADSIAVALDLDRGAWLRHARPVIARRSEGSAEPGALPLR